MAGYEDPTWQSGMRIRFDYNNMLSSHLGPGLGIDPAAIGQSAPQVARAHVALQQLRREGKLAWAELPNDVSLAGTVMAQAAKVRGHFDNFVVLGIGGSALGSIALQQALLHPFHNYLLPPDRRGPRMFFLDNVDPDLNAGLLDAIDPARTLFNVITKSGSTAETMSQFLIFREQLRRRLGESHREHIVATTDPQSGLLRKLAATEGYDTLPVPPGVGGRFSVLSPVGLLSAAVSGIDVAELLAGAAYADRYCREPEVTRNPAYMNGLLQYIAYLQGRHIVVMMPYAQALYGIADWFRQLWAESLGKRAARDGSELRVGPTPVKALGTTDQHSQVQLYVEGPRDKVINFLAVERWQCEVSIPETQAEGLTYLGGHTLNELMQAERMATELAVTNAGQANCTLTLPEINAFTVGQLMFLLEIQTAFSGELYDIDAFDQPGVEEGKIATYALLGRSGYEPQRAEITARLGKRSSDYVI